MNYSYLWALIPIVFVISLVLLTLMKLDSKSHGERAQALCSVLEQPASISRVWYEQNIHEARCEISLYAVNIHGEKMQLSRPYETAEVWRKLQFAGIMVQSPDSTT